MSNKPTGPDGTTPPKRYPDSSTDLVRPEGMSDADWEQFQRDNLANTGSADAVEPIIPRPGT